MRDCIRVCSCIDNISSHHRCQMTSQRFAGGRPDSLPTRIIAPTRRDNAAYLFCRPFRSRTPGPPPFSSMNSTPAASSARRTAKSFAAVRAVRPTATSARLIVFTPSADSRARSAALHCSRARAALICALERGSDFMLTCAPIWVISPHMGEYGFVKISRLEGQYETGRVEK